MIRVFVALLILISPQISFARDFWVIQPEKKEGDQIEVHWLDASYQYQIDKITNSSEEIVALPAGRIVNSDSKGRYIVPQEGEKFGWWMIKHEDGGIELFSAKGVLAAPDTIQSSSAIKIQGPRLWAIESLGLAWTRVSTLDPNHYSASIGLQLALRRRLSSKVDVFIRSQVHGLGLDSIAQTQSPLRIEAGGVYWWTYSQFYGMDFFSMEGTKFGIGASVEHYKNGNSPGRYITEYSDLKVSTNFHMTRGPLFAGGKIAVGGGDVTQINVSGHFGYVLSGDMSLKMGYELFLSECNNKVPTPNNQLPFREGEGLLFGGIVYKF